MSNMDIIIEKFTHKGPKKANRGVQVESRNFTATRTLTESEFGGLVTTNGAASAISIVLPPSANVVGRSMQFVVNENQRIAISPPDAEAFLGKSNGKSRYNATKGGALVVIGSTDGFTILSEMGTWTDET